MKDCMIGILTGFLVCGMDWWDFNCLMQYILVFLTVFVAVLMLLDQIEELKMGLSAITRKSHSHKNSNL